jgi:hypothetical protein
MVLRKNCDLLFTDLIYSRRFSGIYSKKEKIQFSQNSQTTLGTNELSTLTTVFTFQACLLAHLEIQKSYFPAQQ